MVKYEELTRLVCQIAREAGVYLRTEQKKLDEKQVEQKQTHDYVSYVDKTSEKQIVKALKEILPEVGFQTEEATARRSGEEKFWWVIDPLDGTTNYIHGGGPYAISIALRNEREVLLGVVYDVWTDECFYAWKCGGAWLNGEQIHVKPQHSIEEAILGIEFPYNPVYRSTGLKLIDHFSGYCGAIRMNGSAALSLCWVASGRWDGWLEQYLGPWDFMAGMLIVREAEGKVTNYEGKEDMLEGNAVVASNGTIHNDLLNALK